MEVGKENTEGEMACFKMGRSQKPILGVEKNEQKLKWRSEHASQAKCRVSTGILI